MLNLSPKTSLQPSADPQHRAVPAEALLAVASCGEPMPNLAYRNASPWASARNWPHTSRKSPSRVCY